MDLNITEHTHEATSLTELSEFTGNLIDQIIAKPEVWFGLNKPLVIFLQIGWICQNVSR